MGWVEHVLDVGRVEKLEWMSGCYGALPRVDRVARDVNVGRTKILEWSGGSGVTDGGQGCVVVRRGAWNHI